MDLIIDYLIEHDLIENNVFPVKDIEDLVVKNRDWYLPTTIETSLSKMSIGIEGCSLFWAQLLWRFCKENNDQLLSVLLNLYHYGYFTKVLAQYYVFYFESLQCIPVLIYNMNHINDAIICTILETKDNDKCFQLLSILTDCCDIHNTVVKSGLILNKNNFVFEWIQKFNLCIDQFMEQFILHGNIDALKKYIELGGILNLSTEIIDAMDNKIISSKNIKFLLKCGIYHPGMIQYCVSGDLEMLELIKEYDLDSEYLSMMDISVLANQNWQFISKFIQYGFNISTYSYSIIEYCVNNGYVEKLNHMLELTNPAEIDLNQFFRYITNANQNHVDMVKLLLMNGADIKSTSASFCLNKSIILGLNELAHFLLDMGVNIYCDECWSLRLTVLYGRMELFKRLMEYPHDQYMIDTLPCYFSFTTNNFDEKYIHNMVTIHKLLMEEYNADPRVSYYYLFRYCAKFGYEDLTNYFLQTGADVHALADFALIWSSYEGHLSIVNTLLEYGADINPDKEDYGWSQGDFNDRKISKNDHDIVMNSEYKPLVAAAVGKHWDVCRLLIEHGSDVGVLKNIIMYEELEKLI
jgi:ankyrin repeat protein